jgi:hypothetical protein
VAQATPATRSTDYGPINATAQLRTIGKWSMQSARMTLSGALSPFRDVLERAPARV